MVTDGLFGAVCGRSCVFERVTALGWDATMRLQRRAESAAVGGMKGVWVDGLGKEAALAMMGARLLTKRLVDFFEPGPFAILFEVDPIVVLFDLGRPVGVLVLELLFCIGGGCIEVDDGVLELERDLGIWE